MIKTLFEISFALLLLMDPIGNIPIFLCLFQKIEKKRCPWVILRESFSALMIMLIASIVGDPLLKALSISHESIFLSGGIVLFVIAMRLLFSESSKPYYANFLEDHEEPFIFPLAIPLIAGPSVLASIVIYSRQIHSLWAIMAAICIVWTISTTILLGSILIQKTCLGELKGLKVLERLMGLVLIVIAVNMFLQGVSLFQQETARKEISRHIST